MNNKMNQTTTKRAQINTTLNRNVSHRVSATYCWHLTTFKSVSNLLLTSDDIQECQHPTADIHVQRIHSKINRTWGNIMSVFPPDNRFVLAQLSVNITGSDVITEGSCVRWLLAATAMSYDGKLASHVTVSATSSGIIRGGWMSTLSRSGREPQFAGPPTDIAAILMPLTLNCGLADEVMLQHSTTNNSCSHLLTLVN